MNSYECLIKIWKKILDQKEPWLNIWEALHGKYVFPTIRLCQNIPLLAYLGKISTIKTSWQTVSKHCNYNNFKSLKRPKNSNSGQKLSSNASLSFLSDLPAIKWFNSTGILSPLPSIVNASKRAIRWLKKNFREIDSRGPDFGASRFIALGMPTSLLNLN